MLRLPPSPTLSTNPFSPSHTATGATAATPVQPQPLPSPTQPPVPVTSRAQPLGVAPTHAPAETPGATTFQLPPPVQPVTTTYQVPPPAQPSPPPTPLASSRPTVLPREDIDWNFCDATLRCMQGTRAAAFADVSSTAHRLWGLFAPDSDPSVAFVQARAATTSASDELIRDTNTLVLALCYFHNNAGRGYVWNQSEYRPDATARPPPPPPTTAAPTAATPPQPTTNAPTRTSVPTPPTRTTPARSGPMTDDEHHAVTRQYDVVDMRKLTPLVRLPFPANSDAAVYLGMFLASVKLAMREVLTIRDESGKQSFDTPPWVKGWHRTLHKCRAIGYPQVMAPPLTRLIDDFFVHVVQELGIDGTGPSAFKKLLQLPTNHIDDGDQGRAFQQLSSFGVPSSTDFSTFLRAFKQRVLLAQGTEKIFKPTDAMVVEIVRGITSRQYPSLMPTLYPGRLMTTSQPFATVEDIWSAFEVLATNKTPAINGQGFHATSYGGHITYSSSPPPPAQHTNTRGRGTRAMGSASNPMIRNVAGADRDPFCEDESDWSLRHYEEVYMVTITISTQDPPLLTPLLTRSARAQALRAHGGHCLDCNGTDHSMKTCPQDFLNISGILNPALGQLNNGGHAYRQWQQRMRSYRRGQYEHNVDRNSNRYAHRNDNHGGTYHNSNRGANNNANNNNRYNHDHSSQHRGNNGRSNNRRHNNGRSHNNGRPHDNGRSHGNGNRQFKGQQFQHRRAAAASQSTAMTVHDPATYAHTAAAPSNMQIGNNNATNPNQRQPGTFRTN